MTYFQPGPTVAEYRVAEGGDSWALSAEVSSWISQGFMPHGSVAAAYVDWWTKLYQAMVKFHPPVQYACTAITATAPDGSPLIGGLLTTGV